MENFIIAAAGAAVGTVGAAIFGVCVKMCRNAYISYDRSCLVWLGTDPINREFAKVPFIVGPMPYTELNGRVESNLDPRNVVGRVEGHPLWVERPCKLFPGISQEECYHERGYYAHVIFHWHRWAEVKDYIFRGFHIRRIRYNDELPTDRENRFLGFGTESEPDPKEGIAPHIADVTCGWRSPFRLQPYAKGGFLSSETDISLRRLSPFAAWLRPLIRSHARLKQ